MHPLQTKNGQRMQALANMQIAMDAGEERVQQATDDTFEAMQATLTQSETNNRTLAERNVQLTRENSTLKQQLKEITENSAANKKAQKASSTAEQERVNDFVKNSKALCQNISKFAQDKKQTATDYRKAGQGNLSPVSAQYYAQKHDGYISDMNKFEELAKTIEELVIRLEQAEKH